MSQDELLDYFSKSQVDHSLQDIETWKTSLETTRIIEPIPRENGTPAGDFYKSMIVYNAGKKDKGN